MRVIFLVRGLGEYAQGQAVAYALKKRGHKVKFFLDHPFLAQIVRRDRFPFIFFKSPDSLQKILDKEKAEALFLCNSHTTYRYRLLRPPDVGRVFSLDSNWLFNNSLYQKLGMEKFLTYDWIETIYVVFPPEFFFSNLKENGGYYEIEKSFYQKIKTPGFIPSGEKLEEEKKQKRREKFKVKENEKVIVTYFSRRQFHKTMKKDYVGFFQKIVSQVASRLSLSKRKIKVIHLSSKNSLSTIAYDNFLDMADLFVMHFGYGTLPRLFHKQIPVICFLPKPESPYFSSYYELSPCIKRGLVDYLFFPEVNLENVKKKISRLLDDAEVREKIKENQKKYFISGEEKVIEDLEKLCSK